MNKLDFVLERLKENNVFEGKDDFLQKVAMLADKMIILIDKIFIVNVDNNNRTTEHEPSITDTKYLVDDKFLPINLDFSAILPETVVLVSEGVQILCDSKFDVSKDSNLYIKVTHTTNDNNVELTGDAGDSRRGILLIGVHTAPMEESAE